MVDQGFRIVQDASEHHYRIAFNESTTDAAPTVMAFGEGGAIAGVDLLLAKAVENAARQIDWSSNLGFGQLLVPSAWPGIWQSEASGFESFGLDLGKAIYSAIVGRL